MKLNRNNQALSKLSQDSADILRRITDALNSEVQVVIDGVISKEISDKVKAQAIKDIEAKVLTADTDIKSWLTTNVPEAYVIGVNSADVLLKSANIKIAGGIFNVQTIRAGNQTHLKAVNLLLSDAYMDFGHGMNGFVKGARHVLNDALKRQLARQMATGRLDGAGIREIKKDIVALMQKQKFTALIDKGGRSWALSDYSEMLARTHLVRSNTDATINRCMEYNVDSVEVSTHANPCEVCVPYEGRIYSLTGKSKEHDKYPDGLIPIHPRCKHTLLPRPDLDVE